MTISNTPIVLTDFRRFFHDYVKHTPLRRCQQVFPWQCQAHTSSTDFRRFSHDYQTHPSPRLTSAGFPMTMSRTHLFNWLQQVFPWLCQAHTSSTDFSRFFHDYVKYTPLQLTTARSSMTMLSTHLEAMGMFDSHGKSCWSQSMRWVCLI
jgi:hypothetical protein